MQVHDKTTKETIADAEVRLGVYRSITDARGLATVDVPKGSYALTVWKLGYELFSTELSVADTATIEVEIAVERETAHTGGALGVCFDSWGHYIALHDRTIATL